MKKEKITGQRIFYFITGLFLLALGISLAIKSGLGTSPVSSIPQILSIITNISVGNMTFIYYLFCILIQYLILKDEFTYKQGLQIVFSLIFGVFIDLFMKVLTFLDINLYLERIILLSGSILIMALGLSLMLRADLIMNAPDGLCHAIAYKTNLDFANVKSIVDIVSVAGSAALSLVFLGTIVGIREGTIISALLIGRLVGVVEKKIIIN